MYKLIYLPEALVAYIQEEPSSRPGKKCFRGKWKNKEELQTFLDTYYFYKFHQHRANVDLVFGKPGEPPKFKVSLPKHLFEIVEFPDV